MTDLERIKEHLDGHGVGCAVFRDHVAISIAWRSEGIDGLERRMETTKRASSLTEACAIVGCHCLEAACKGCSASAA